LPQAPMQWVAQCILMLGTFTAVMFAMGLTVSGITALLWARREVTLSLDRWFIITVMLGSAVICASLSITFHLVSKRFFDDER